MIMIRYSIIALSLFILVEAHSSDSQRTQDLELSILVKKDTKGITSVNLFQNGEEINIEYGDSYDVSKGFVLNNGKQLFLNQMESTQRLTVDSGSSLYTFCIDSAGNIDISPEKGNVDTDGMSFVFKTYGTVKNSNPILFNSLFIRGDRIQNDSILKTRKYTFYYKTFDNYGFFDSRSNDKITSKNFALNDAILLQKLKQFRKQHSSQLASSESETRSSKKNSRNNYGIMLGDHVKYTGKALQVNSFGLMEYDNVHFDGKDSELNVNKGEVVVHGALFGTFASTDSIKVGNNANMKVHNVNINFVEGLQQPLSQQKQTEFLETLNKAGLPTQNVDFSLPLKGVINLSLNQTIEYSPLWQWNFTAGEFNNDINRNLLVGLGLSRSEIEILEKKKWHCEDENLINRNDYDMISKNSTPIKAHIPGQTEPVKLYLVSTGSGAGGSCGFIALTKDRASVYSENANTTDLCRKNIIEKLLEAIDGRDAENREKILELIAPQLKKYISTMGNAIYDRNTHQYKWEAGEEKIWHDIESVFQSERPEDFALSEEKLENEKGKLWNEIKNEILNSQSLIELLNLSEEEMTRLFCKKYKKEIIAFSDTCYGLKIKIRDDEKNLINTLDEAITYLKILIPNITETNKQSKQRLTVYSADNEQLRSFVMRSSELRSKFAKQLQKIEEVDQQIQKLYQLPETTKAYLKNFLGRTGVQLEVTTSPEETGVLHAIAYIHKASLALVAKQDVSIASGQTYQKGQTILLYDNPEAENVIYTLYEPGHYSKAVTEEQYFKAVIEYNK